MTESHSSLWEDLFWPVSQQSPCSITFGLKAAPNRPAYLGWVRDFGGGDGRVWPSCGAEIGAVRRFPRLAGSVAGSVAGWLSGWVEAEDDVSSYRTVRPVATTKSLDLVQLYFTCI